MEWYKFDIRDLTDNEYNKWYSLTSKEAKQRIDKFKNENDKKRTVTGEMLARLAISKKCNVKVEDIVFLKKEHGKPFAKDLDIEFNVSHSEDLVVCAINNTAVGIDIEKIRPINLLVAKRFCTQKELEYLFGYTPCLEDFKFTEDKNLLTRFYELWTAKEAFGKFLGSGLANISCPAKENVKTITENDYIISIYH